PTNSPRVNCQPSTSAITIPSSTTRFVDASSNTIAAVKSAPLRNSVRASATEAYEQDDDAIPSAVAVASELGESSGRSRSTRSFGTSAWTIADSRNPSTSAQRISQVIPTVKLTARQSSCGTSTATII